MRFHLSSMVISIFILLLTYSVVKADDKQLTDLDPISIIENAKKWSEKLPEYNSFSCIVNSTVEVFEDEDLKSKTEVISNLDWELPDEIFLSIISARKEVKKKMESYVFGMLFFRNWIVKEINIQNRIIVPTPFHKDGYKLYNFSIDGFITIDDENFYIIKFVPKSKNQPLFKGELYISSYNYKVVRVNMIFDDPTYTPRFFKYLRFENSYARYMQSFWLPDQLVVEACVKPPFEREHIVRRTSEYYDYAVNIDNNKKDTPNSQGDPFRKIFDFERNVLHKSEKDTLEFSIDSIDPKFRTVINSAHDTQINNDSLKTTSPRRNESNLYFGKFSDFFSYNRIEGSLVGIGYGLRNIPGTSMGIYNKIAYGFADRKLKYHLNINKQLFSQNSVTIGIDIFNHLNSEDSWILSRNQNTLAALFLKEDFWDYYKSKGWNLYISKRFNRNSVLKIQYSNDNQKPANSNTNWNIFGFSKGYRLNPQINEGKMKSISTTFRYNSHHFANLPFNGWMIEGNIIYSGSSFLHSDFDFTRWDVKIKRLQWTSLSQFMAIQFWIGSSDGYVPVQKKFYLGGLGTLRGYSYKSFRTSQFALINMDYHFGGRLLNKMPNFIPIKKSMELVFFTDVGWIYYEKDFNLLNLNFSKDRKTNIGVGLADINNWFRLDFAKSIEEKSFKITFEIFKRF